MRCDKIVLIGNLGSDPEERSVRSPLNAMIYGRLYGRRKSVLTIRNEANLNGGENVGGIAATPEATEGSDVGGTTATPAATEAGGSDDGDPEPERRRPGRPRKTCNTPPAGNPPAPSAAQAADALIQFDARPASSFVRLPVVCSLYACSPATAWRWVKAGRIPAPLKLSDRVTAWRVGDLRESLAKIAA